MFSERQFRLNLLLTSSTLLVALGYIIIAIGVIAVIITPFLITGLTAQLFAISGIVIVTIIQALLFLSLGELIEVIVDTNERTLTILQGVQLAAQVQERAPHLRAVEAEAQ